MMTCDICQGSKHIRIPVASRPSVLTCDASITEATIEISYKTFPCPQCCGKQVADERIELAGVALTIRDEYAPEAEKFYRDEAAQVLARHLVKHGSIDFEKIPAPGRPGKSELTGVVGLVTRTQINRIEDRVRTEAQTLMERVIGLALDNIATWGSFYTGLSGPIEKGRAIDCIRAAFSKVKGQQ